MPKATHAQIDAFFKHLPTRFQHMKTSSRHAHAVGNQQVFAMCGQSGAIEDDIVVLGDQEEVTLVFGKWHGHWIPELKPNALAELATIIDDLIAHRRKIVEVYQDGRLVHASLVGKVDAEWTSTETTEGSRLPIGKPKTSIDRYFKPAS